MHMKDMVDTCDRQFKKVLHVVGNYSAHPISYGKMDKVLNLVLPPNMTLLIQPVDATVGRSFKAVFKRFLTQQILEYSNGLDDDTNKKFSLREAVTVHDGVLLMAKVREVVPKIVLLNGWLTTGITAPHQELDVKQIMGKFSGVIKRAIRPFSGCFLKQII